MFDILSQAVAETADCEINQADGKPMIGEKGKRCSITFYGPSTDQFAAMQARQRKRLHERVANDQTELTPDEEIADAAEDLASITKSFNHFIFPGDFASPEEMYRACYSERRIGFVRERGNRFVSNWGNFSTGSGKA